MFIPDCSFCQVTPYNPDFRMKKTLYFLAVGAMLTATAYGQAKFVAKPQRIAEIPHETLAIGAKAPDFRLPGTDGKFYTLANFAAAKVLVIVFTCTHCPTAQAYEDRIKQITTDYKPKGVQVVAISPNSPVALQLEELGYTDLNDDYENMAVRAKDKAFNFPYLYDGDTHAVSVKYGPVATPHAFVFDQQRVLRYTGRLDASEKPGSANAEDLRQAIDAVLTNQPIAQPTTKTFGCSVKWAWKDEGRAQVQKEWESKPLILDEIDEAGIKKLLRNDDSKKLRLINVWATWCGPCVLEYPEFVAMQRMYGERDFEFVSVSADKLSAKERALSVLTKKQSHVKNYIFNGVNSYALIEAIDPKWNGALPYTMLVEPGGKVVYAAQGTIKPVALRKLIVDNPKIGRYF